MKNKKTIFHGIRLLAVIVASFVVLSCNGQENTNNIQNHNKEEKIIPKDKNIELKEPNKQENQTSFPFINLNHQISQVVRTVYQDSRGDMWFGTQNGAFRLSGKSLIHINNIKSESGKGVTIKDIAEDKDGKLWFGHTNGISSIDGDIVTNYYESDGLLSNDVWSIAVDKNGEIWIGTIEGLCKFNRGHFTVFEIPEGKIDSARGISSTKMIHDIMEDSKGRLWFSTNGGIYIKDNNILSNLSEKDGLTTNFVNQVIEYKKGHFWISTSKGLFSLKGDSLINMTELLFKTSKGTGSIIRDSKGNIWFNCHRNIYSLYEKKLTEYPIEGNNGPLTFQIYEDLQNRLWFVGYGGAYRYENGRFINITEKRALVKHHLKTNSTPS